MREVAEERLAHLRDMYGPGWMDSENSDVDFSRLSSVQPVSRQQSRTREYLRKVAATRSEPYQSSHTGEHQGGVVGGTWSFGTNRSRSSVEGMGDRRRGLQGPPTASSDSVGIDLPMFTETEDIV